MAVSMEDTARLLDRATADRPPATGVRVGTHATRDGDFDRLWQEYAARVRGLVRRLLPDGAPANDVVQETFLRAFNAGLHHEYRDPSRARSQWPWLATVARNLCLDHRRRMRGVSVSPLDESELPLRVQRVDDDPADAVEVSSRLDELSTVLGAMDERQARVLVLKHVQGLSYREIARRERVSVGALKSVLARARRAFRECHASLVERAGTAVLPLTWLGSRLRAARDRFLAESEAGRSTVASVTASPGVVQGFATTLLLGAVATATAVAGGIADPAASATVAEATANPPAEVLAPPPPPTGVLSGREGGKGPDHGAPPADLPGAAATPVLPPRVMVATDDVLPGDGEPASAGASAAVSAESDGEGETLRAQSADHQSAGESPHTEGKGRTQVFLHCPPEHERTAAGHAVCPAVAEATEVIAPSS